jgi:hypothetical protein
MAVEKVVGNSSYATVDTRDKEWSL